MTWEGCSSLVIISGMPVHHSLPGLLQTSATVSLPTSVLYLLVFLVAGPALGSIWYGRRQRRRDRTQHALVRRLKWDITYLVQRLERYGALARQILVETDRSGRILHLVGPSPDLGPRAEGPRPRPERLDDWIHPAEKELFRDFRHRLLSSQGVEERLFRLQAATGPDRFFLVAAEPIREGPEAVVQALRFAWRRADEPFPASMAGSQRAASEEILTLVLQGFARQGAWGLKMSLLQALDPIARLVGADLALLIRARADGEPPDTVFVWRQEGFCLLPDRDLARLLLASEALCAELAAGRRYHQRFDGGAGPAEAGWREIREHFGLSSLVGLPVETGEGPAEVLVFGSRQPTVRWNEEDLDTLQVLASLYASARRRELDRQMLENANRKFEAIVEFLPDPTFVINRRGEVVAWNRAMVDLTGVPKDEILGEGGYAHALPFYGERLPTLVNHFGDTELGQWRQLYDFVEVNGNTLYAECFVPSLNDGAGAFLWSTASALCDEEGQVIGAIQSLRDVTYRKKAEQALRNSEERYRRLVETMNDGMGVVSAGGMITYANDSLCRMLGLEKGQILGASLETLFPALRDQGPLEDWPGWHTPGRAALELDIPRPDGSRFPSRVSPAAILDEEGRFMGGFAIVSDMTTIREAEANIRKLNESLEQRVAESTAELRSANAALRASEARYRRIIESLQEGYIFYSQDTRRRFTYVSPSFRNLTGFQTPEQLCDRLQEDLERPGNEEARAMADKSLLGFRQSAFDLQISCADGTRRIMEILEVPIFDEGGEVVSLEGIGRDVTEARHNLRLVEEAQQQLVEQQKLAALGSLVAGLSHEINTPVGIGVTAASHLAEEVAQCHRRYEGHQLTRGDFEDFLDSSRESADLIAANLNRAADLLQNFKQVASDQANSMERVFNLREYLGDVVRSFSPRIRNSGFHILVDCPDDLEMKCDPGALYQILSNLVMNSLNHGFEGLLVGQIDITARRENGRIVLQYADNGNGMRRKDLARIYEPFFTTKRGRGGTGLGLHIVYNNVTQNLGGKISCASKPGRGTRFTISVPLLAEVEHG